MPKPLTLKVIFVVSVLLLLLFAIARYLSNFFIDQESLDKSFIRHLPYLIIGALLLGMFYIFFFKKAFPKGWNKQSSGGKVAVIFVFLVLAFAILRQGSVTLNLLLPASRKESFQGVIMKKEIEKTGKGTKFYSIIISITDKTGTKTMAVSKKIFNKYNEGDTLQKEINTGCFGIMYVNE